MAQNQTITIPLATAEKLAALGRAMLQLAQEMKSHAGKKGTKPPIILPELKRPADVPKDQEWFWSEEWLAGEREVNEALAKGEYEVFDSVDELIADLHRHV
jgi:hypothetical protein